MSMYAAVILIISHNYSAQMPSLSRSYSLRVNVPWRKGVHTYVLRTEFTSHTASHLKNGRLASVV